MIIRTIGKLGDIVYAMAAMRGHHLVTGDKCLVRVQQYHDPNNAKNHFYKEHQEAIGRLLYSQQDYISDVVMFPLGDIAASHVNLGTWLDYRRLHLDNLARSLCHYMKVHDRFAAERWLKIDAPENGLNIINVTDRWKSMDREGFWRAASDRIPDDAVFIGTPVEHDDFQRLLNRSLRRQEVPNLFALSYSPRNRRGDSNRGADSHIQSRHTCHVLLDIAMKFHRPIVVVQRGRPPSES